MDLKEAITTQLQIYEDCADILSELNSCVRIDRFELNVKNPSDIIETLVSDGFADKTTEGIIKNERTHLGILHYKNKYMDYLAGHSQYLPKEEEPRTPIGFTQ